MTDTVTNVFAAACDALDAGRNAASEEQRDQAAADLGAALGRQFALLQHHIGEPIPDSADFDGPDGDGRISVALDGDRVAGLDHDLGADYAVVVEQLDDGTERVTPMRDGEPANLGRPSDN